MKLATSLFVFAAACSADGGSSSAPDAALVTPDAPVVVPEPKPVFTVSTGMGGKLAIDDTGIRATYTLGLMHTSQVTFSLKQMGGDAYCGVTVQPAFVQFGSASTSTRHFKTVVLDIGAGTVLDDQCHWDDAYMLQEIKNQFGNVIVGFAQARFATDRPHLDVYFDAEKPLPNSTANIVYAGGGLAYAMAADGRVDGTIIEPLPGTLTTGLYDF